MSLEIFSPDKHVLTRLLEKEEHQFSSPVFTNMLLLPQWNLEKQRSFASLSNFLDMVFTSILIKKRMRGELHIMQTETMLWRFPQSVT